MHLPLHISEVSYPPQLDVLPLLIRSPSSLGRIRRILDPVTYRPGRCQPRLCWLPFQDIATQESWRFWRPCWIHELSCPAGLERVCGSHGMTDDATLFESMIGDELRNILGHGHVVVLLVVRRLAMIPQILTTSPHQYRVSHKLITH